MAGDLFVDLRNVYDAATMAGAGLRHVGVGKGAAAAVPLPTVDQPTSEYGSSIP